jgi:hypothetical protein
LKGAAWLHLPAEQTAQYELIVASVGKNCSVLFTLPGMGSFNMWSGVPTPNGWNLTAWMRGFSAARQEKILEIVRSDSRACAVVNRRLEHFWDMGEDESGIAALPLVHFILTDMPKVGHVGEYEIRVNPHRTSPWLSDGNTPQAR